MRKEGNRQGGGISSQMCVRAAFGTFQKEGKMGERGPNVSAVEERKGRLGFPYRPTCKRRGGGGGRKLPHP